MVVVESKESKITEFLTESNKELQRFNSTKKFIYLQQSAEKSYAAYTLLLEALLRREIYSHADIRAIGRKLGNRDRDMKTLYEYEDELHAFFYEGKRDEQVIIKRIRTSHQLIRKFLGRIKSAM